MKKSIKTENRTFACVFERNKDGWYTVTVPAIPAIITQGKNMEQAQKMVKEAIELFYEASDSKDIDVILPNKNGSVILGTVTLAVRTTK